MVRLHEAGGSHPRRALEELPIPNRSSAPAPRKLPPYFASLTRERRARMIERCAQPGKLQDRVKHGWIPLWTPPPPPSYIPKEVFAEKMRASFEARFADTKALVDRLRARGGKIVFVRFPLSGDLKALEDRTTPRATTWDRPSRKLPRPAFTSRISPSWRISPVPSGRISGRRLRRVYQTSRPTPACRARHGVGCVLSLATEALVRDAAAF